MISDTWQDGLVVKQGSGELCLSGPMVTPGRQGETPPAGGVS